MEQKFYICKHCGNIIAKVKDAGVPVVCCGEPMSEIVPGTTDAAVEKHVPVWTVENGIVHVKVGSVTACTCPPEFPVCVCGGKAKAKLITRKPIEANSQELEENRRSRSAHLRVLEKC